MASGLDSGTDLLVCHNEENKEFFIKINGDDHKAFLQYRWISSDIADLYHTEVPAVFRGKGVAKLLAKAAFDFFSNKKVTMQLTCTYLQKYGKENPQYADHICSDKELQNKL